MDQVLHLSIFDHYEVLDLLSESLEPINELFSLVSVFDLLELWHWLLLAYSRDHTVLKLWVKWEHALTTTASIPSREACCLQVDRRYFVILFTLDDGTSLERREGYLTICIICVD